jgi:hypothetical protein
MEKDESKWVLALWALIAPVMVGLIRLVQALPIPFPQVIEPNVNPHLFVFFIIVLPILIAFILLIWLQIRELKDEFRYRMRPI